MSRLNPDQFRDGHRLPFRVEIQMSQAGPFAVVIDADHRDIGLFVSSFEAMLSYVETANTGLTHYNKFQGITTTGPELAVPLRLDDSHPCDELPPTLATAFECLVVGSYRAWITPDLLKELRSFRFVDETGEVPKHLVDQWIEWRAAEDAELVRRGIHRAPTAVIQAFRTASRTHLTVVQ